MPSFPVTSRRLGTQFVNLSCLSLSLVQCRDSCLCCKAVPRLVGRWRRAWRRTQTPCPHGLRHLSLQFSLRSSRRTLLPVGADLSGLPSPIPRLLPVSQSTRLTTDSFHIYCRKQGVGWERALGLASGCSRAQLGMEDNGLDASLGGRLCFEVHEIAQEVNQIRSSLLDQGRELLLCLLEVSPVYSEDWRSV